MAEERVWGPYTPQDYRFPELYLEGAEGDKCVWLDEQSRKYWRKPVRGLRKLCLIPYEEAWRRVVDPETGIVKSKALVVIPWLGGKGMLLKPGTKLSLVDATGVQVSYVGLEGSRVREGSLIAYVLTGKGETRSLRAGVEGVVVLILVDLSESPERQAYAIASEDDVVWIDSAEA